MHWTNAQTDLSCRFEEAKQTYHGLVVVSFRYPFFELQEKECSTYGGDVFTYDDAWCIAKRGKKFVSDYSVVPVNVVLRLWILLSMMMPLNSSFTTSAIPVSSILLVALIEQDVGGYFLHSCLRLLAWRDGFTLVV